MSQTSTERTIIVYADENGKEPVTDWLASFRDKKIRTRILRRINRIEQGNFGDHRHIVGGEGIWELRLDFGPGYRVYYAEDGATVVLLLCAGEKKSQNRDIKKAITYWRDYQEQKSHE